MKVLKTFLLSRLSEYIQIYLKYEKNNKIIIKINRPLCWSGVTRSPQKHFPDSNPAEVDGLFQNIILLSTRP